MPSQKVLVAETGSIGFAVDQLLCLWPYIRDLLRTVTGRELASHDRRRLEP